MNTLSSSASETASLHKNNIGKWLKVAILLTLTAPSSTLFAQTLAFISNQKSNDVTVIDTDKQHIIKTIPVGDQPAGIAVTPNGQWAFVSNPGDGTVSVIDTTTLDVVNTLHTGEGPLAIAADNHSLFVADWYSNTIDVFSIPSWQLNTQFKTGKAPSGLSLSTNNRLYVSNRDDNTVIAIETSTGKTIATANTQDKPWGIRLSADEKTLYVANVKSNSISIINTELMQASKHITVGERPYDVSLAQQDSLVFITNQYDDTVSVIDTATYEVITSIDTGEYPEGINTHPDDQHVYVANWFENTVSVLDARSLSVIHTYTTGDGPRAYGAFFKR